MVDAVVSTGANIVDQDFFEALGFHHYVGDPLADDELLRQQQIDRIYDTYIDENQLRVCDMTIAEIAQSLEHRPYSSREFIQQMGVYLAMRDTVMQSVVLSAYQHQVPIFVPAFSDCSAGFGLVHHQWNSPESHLTIDSVRDFRELTQCKLASKYTGLVMIGGGVPKNFAQDTVVAAELLGFETSMHKYAIQITVADERDGGLSGSTLREAHSWGKVNKTIEQIVFAEATLAFPLLAGYVYGKNHWQERSRVIEPHFLPQSQTEKLLADIWQQMFRVSPVSRQDNFFQLGGDSLSVVAFLEMLKEKFGVLLPIPNFVNDPSLASLARLFDEYKRAKLCSVDEVRLTDVEIVPFEDKYLEKTVKLVSESFTTREPEVVALGITKQEFDVYAAICCRRRLKNLSYVAVQKASGRVVGYCLSEDFANYLLAEVEKQDNSDSELPESMTPIFALWHSLEETYKSSYGEVKPGDILYVQLSGAASDVDSTAIALALEKKVLEVAASFNYKRVATTCTQIFTKYIALEEMGYQRKYAIDYDVFEFEGERIFSSIAKTHQEAVLVEKRL